MRCVQTPALHPARASQRSSSAPRAAQRAVSVTLASCSMVRHVFQRLSAAATTTEERTRYYLTLLSVQSHTMHNNVQMITY